MIQLIDRKSTFQRVVQPSSRLDSHFRGEVLEARRYLTAVTTPWVSQQGVDQFDESEGFGFGFDIATDDVQAKPRFLGTEFATQIPVQAGELKPSCVFDICGLDGVYAELIANGRFGIEYGFYVHESFVHLLSHGQFRFKIQNNGDGSWRIHTGLDTTKAQFFSESPEISAYADLVLEIDGRITTTACQIECSEEVHRLQIDERVPLFGVNPQQLDEAGRHLVDENGNRLFDGALHLLGAIATLDVAAVDSLYDSRRQQTRARISQALAEIQLEHATSEETRVQAREAILAADRQLLKSQDAATSANQRRTVFSDASANLQAVFDTATSELLGIPATILSTPNNELNPVSEIGSLTLNLPKSNLSDASSDGRLLRSSTLDPVRTLEERRELELAHLQLDLGRVLEGYGLSPQPFVSHPDFSSFLTPLTYELEAAWKLNQIINVELAQQSVAVRFFDSETGESIVVDAKLDGQKIHSDTIVIPKHASLDFVPPESLSEVRIDFELEQHYMLANYLQLDVGTSGAFEVLHGEFSAYNRNLAFGPVEEAVHAESPHGPLIQKVVALPSLAPVSLTTTLVDLAADDSQGSNDVPTEINATDAIELTNNKVVRGVDGAVVGLLEWDIPTNIVNQLVSDDRFELIAGILKLKPNVSLPWGDGTEDIEVAVTLVDKNGVGHRKTFFIISASLPPAPAEITVHQPRGQGVVDGRPASGQVAVISWQDIAQHKHHVTVTSAGNDVIANLEVHQCAPDGVCSALISGLDHDQQYQVSVVHESDLGFGPSGVLAFRTRSAPPTKPKTLRAIGLTTEEIKLNWSDALGESHYILEGYDAEGDLIVLEELAPDTTTYKVGGLSPNSSIQFVLYTENESGAAFNEVVGKTRPSIPTHPAPLTVSSNSPTSVHLRWTDVENETNYYVIGHVAGSDPKIFAVVGADQPSVTLENLETETLHRFYVVAANEAGQRVSNVVSSKGGGLTAHLSLDRDAILETESAVATLIIDGESLVESQLTLTNHDQSEITIPPSIMFGPSSTRSFEIQGIEDGTADGPQSVQVTVASSDIFVSTTIHVDDDPDQQLTDITSPEDFIIRVDGKNDGDPFEGASPSNGVAHAIDDTTAKYLNFQDLGSGFVVAPNAGSSTVKGVRIYTANDAESRDPASFRLEGGSLDGVFTLIAESDLSLPRERNAEGIEIHTGLAQQTVFFPNTNRYTSYRITFPGLKNALAAHSVQIAEVELLGDVSSQTQRIRGDADQNGVVDFVDFLKLSSNFGAVDAIWADGDFDEDGRVGFSDFLFLAQNFGRTA